MALALNTSHPLFGNILAFVCPNETNDAIIDLKTPARTLTSTNDAYTFGSGVYGRYLAAPAVNNSALLCSPVILTGNRRTTAFTFFAVVNNTLSLSGGGANQPTYFKYSETMGINKANGNLTINSSITTIAAESSLNVLNNGSYTACLTYSGTELDNNENLYHNGLLAASAVPLTTAGTVTMDELHDSGSFTQHATQYNYIVVFDRVLTPTEISDLHASLGADNAFALLDAGSTTPITFDGSIANQTFTAGDSVNVSLVDGQYSGTQTPFTYALTSGSLVGTGLTLSSAGVLSGTATETAVTGLIITGTDADTNTAVSNAFNVTVNAAPTGSSLTISDTLPALDSSLTITYEASPSIGTITISDWANNTDTPLPSVTGITINVRSLVDGSTVYRTTTASTSTGSDCVISNGAIISGTQYEVSALKFNGVDYDIGIAIITAT